MAFCESLFNANLIPTDIEDAVAHRVEGRDFWQGRGGVPIEFTVSHHMIGKLSDDDAHKALELLLGD